jgi:hypothetical protein
LFSKHLGPGNVGRLVILAAYGQPDIPRAYEYLEFVIE